MRYEWKRITKEYEWDKINKYRFMILLLSIDNYFNYIVFFLFVYFNYLHRRKLHEYDDTPAKEYRIIHFERRGRLPIEWEKVFTIITIMEILWNVNRWMYDINENLKRDKIIIK